VSDRNYTSEQNSSHENILEIIIPIGLMVVMVFTTLAHGAVEPWSITAFCLIVIFLFALWAIKGVTGRELTIYIPSTAYPLAALLLLGCVQGLVFNDGSGGRIALSLDS